MTAAALAFDRRCLEREAELVRRYGEILTLVEIAKVFRYPSTQAAQKSHLRGKLPVPLSKMALRRRWFATAKQVAEALTRLEMEDRVKEGAPMS